MKKLIAALTLLATFFIASPTFAYTVKSGDTMTQIARENNLTLQELAKLNPQIQNLDLIHVGQTVHTTPLEIAKPKSVEIQQTIRTNKQALQNPDLIQFSQTVKTTIEDIPKPELISVETPLTSQKTELEGRYSDAEIDLLARLVRAEAQGEPLEGKIAVACVVLNRVDSPKFPGTIQDVIYAPGQFQPVRNGAINKPADDDSIKAVKEALTGSRNMVEDSLFFYNPAIATSHWLDSRETTTVIGHHVFKK